ncbi:hypothetical protein [Winogradskyella helgolandensis]|uniref:hypothetical protein n=1 Tax=Winogradskyella helgolandensis TaxID=2697010 RepID=UPI0015CDE2D4|nr:hypothetical protein [Winogradskyella helgolandensis]
MMQDLSKKISYLNLRKKLWKSKPYHFYIKMYDQFLLAFLNRNKSGIRLIFINGMRRSGNHYLIKTLMESANATVLFYNNLKPHSDIPTVIGGTETKIKTKKKILVILGYEDLSIADFNSSCNLMLDHSFKDINYTKLIICRDVRNVMASRLNHAHMSYDLNTKHDIQIYTKNLWLNHHNTLLDDIYRIRYGYLQEDLKNINLKPFYINELQRNNKVSNRYGGGSSFTSNDFTERFKKFKGREDYEYLIKDLQVLDAEIHKTNWED